jgi:superoxide reductase
MIKDMIHSPSEETGKEKHVPNIEKVNDKTVKVSCGKVVMHPSLENHYIGWMKLFGIDKEGKLKELGSFSPSPVLAQPIADFAVDVTQYKELIALIWCNLHGLWENSLKL